ncbi:MAG TPA: protein kinase [Gemmataceae bacterium]|nr:protein kinase [Gemmataceae bacterium]
MPATAICPPQATLVDFVLGKLAPAEVEQWAAHIEKCPGCTTVIQACTEQDFVVEALKNPGSAAAQRANPLVQSLISKLSTMAPVQDTLLQGSSLSIPADDGSKVEDDDSDDDISFLSPPQGTGEIGRLNGYRILEILGSGGMGVVFRAEDVKLKRAVALKVMKKDVAGKKSARERFLREAQAAAQLEHENIVTIHQVGEANGVPYIAMQWLKGQSLEDRLGLGGRLSAPEIIRFGRQAARGLAAAHARGQVHRDIKPGNLWLEDVETEHGEIVQRVKVLDFGLARVGDEDVRLTQTGTVVGTPAYMAPEQAKGEKVDHRADLFSLGTVMYRMATGRLPFHGANTLAILSALATENPDPPQLLNFDIPPTLSDLIMKLLEKDPAKRIGSATEVVQALAKVELGPGLTAVTRAGSVSDDAASAAHASGSDTVAETADQLAAMRVDRGKRAGSVSDGIFDPSLTLPARRRRRMVAIAIGLALLLISGGAFAAYQLIFKTSKGTLIVEVADDAEVSFSKGELVIKDQKTGEVKYRIKPSEKNKSLPPGKYLVEIRGADGLKVESDKFEIVKNGKATVTVIAAMPNVVATMNSDPDRRAAEWVLSIGGTVKVNGEDLPIKEVVELPLGRFTLTAVDLPRNQLINEAGLVLFDNCKSITYLNFYKSPVDDTGFSHFKNCRDLTILSLDGANVGDAGLAILQGCTKLQIANLYASRVTDAGLAFLKNCKNLTNLSLGRTKVTDQGLMQLADCKDLSVLGLEFTRVTDEGLAPFAKCTKLTTILLSGPDITDAGLAPFKNCKNLNVLFLQGTRITNASLPMLMEAKGLQELNIQQTKITAERIEELHKALPACRIVRDGGTIEPNPSADPDRRAAEWVLSMDGEVVLAPWQPIKNAKDLPSGPFQVIFIDLSQKEKVDDAGLIHLKGLSELRALRLLATQITDAGLVHLKGLAKLETLNLHGTRITDAGVATIKGLPNLKDLGINYTQITDAALADMKAMAKLELLWIDSTRISEAGLAQLKGIPNLRHVSISLPLTDGVAGRLKELPKLTSLGVSYQTGDDCFAQLTGFPRLTWLELGYSQVSANGLAKLGALPNLEHLSLRGCPLANAGLEHLKALSKLTDLDLTETKVTGDGVKKLAAALPHCKITWDGGTIEPKK